MKRIFATIVIMFCAVAVMFAQAPTPETGTVTTWISTHLVTVLTVAYGVYEVLARYIPTIRNYSILSYVIKFIQVVIPNKDKSGDTHE